MKSRLKTRVPKVKSEKEQEDEPRDYWVSSTSCIYQVFKNASDEYFDAKIEELEEKMAKPDLKSSVFLMYQRNRDILVSFKEFDLNALRPPQIKRQGVQTEFRTMVLSDLPLFVRPTIVFSFIRNGKSEIGALWLVPQVHGFKKEELGIFCEVLYRFLMKNFAKDFQVALDYCIAIDTVKAQSITFSDMSNGSVPFLLDDTLNQIRTL